MAAFTIAGLTLKEVVRRKTLVGALLMGLLVLGLSLILILIRARMQMQVEAGKRDAFWLATQYSMARVAISTLCLFAIRSLGSLFAILMAGGAISGEIERGLLAVILPKPIPRWQILLGKWLGLQIVLVCSVMLWTVMVWISLTLQTKMDYTNLLRAGLYSTLYPVVIGTVTLTLSTFAQRLFGTSLAMTLAAFSWMDGIFEGLGRQFEVAILNRLANFASVVLPQGSIAWWVEDAMGGELGIPRPGRRDVGMLSPQFLRDWGTEHLHIAHLDMIYLAVYVVAVFLLGALFFQKRDV